MKFWHGLYVAMMSVAAAGELVQTGVPRSWTNCHANVWARDTGSITCRDLGNGRYEVRHVGMHDWSFNGLATQSVRPGEEFRIDCGSTAIQGVTNAGTFSPSAVLRRNKVTTDWAFAAEPMSPGQVYGRTFLVPDGITELQPRVMGTGPFVGVVGPLVFTSTGRRELERLPSTNRLSTAELEVAVETTTGFFSVTDRRTGRVWTPQLLPGVGLGTRWRPLMAEMKAEGTLELSFYRPDNLLKHGRILFEIQQDELEVTLDLAHDSPLDG